MEAKKRVVVVDDSPLIRDRVTSMCSEIPEVEVVGIAENALDGTSVVRKENPDLVILDIRIPLGSGFDVLRNIGKSNPDTSVIILTNFPFQQYREKAMELGAAAFLSKSEEFDRIPETVRELMGIAGLNGAGEGR
jgi:DNA-binding NarL/FixJ family response regulator